MHWIAERQCFGLVQIRCPNYISSARFVCERARELEFSLLSQVIQKCVVRFNLETAVERPVEYDTLGAGRGATSEE